MNAKTSTKSLIYRTASILTILMMLFAALPVVPAGAVSLNITSIASGTWEATAWPSTLRSGTITVTAGDVNVVGTGTAFLTELSVGNILRTTTELQIGTVASITSDTTLTLMNVPATNRTDIAYHAQGVGPADNVTIADTHNVTIAANPVVQTGTVTVNAGGTLTVDDPGTIFSTLTVNGTVDATIGHNFGELIINNGGVVNAGTNGSYTASSLTINSGGTANVSRDLTVDSTTVIAGTISFSSTTATARTMNFLGAVTLNSGATWNEATVGNGANNNYNFHNNFTNNASVFVTSDTSIHSFVGSGKTISGSTNTAIARVTVAGTYTNSGILSVGHTLTGTGALTNGAAGTLNLGGIVSITTLANAGTATKSGAGPISTSLANFTNTGTLNLTGTGTISGITNNAGGIVNLESSGNITAFDNATATSVLNISDLTPPTITTLTVTVPGNTVNYNGAGAQTVKSMVYSNLVFSGSGDKSITMANGSTLTTGNLSIAPTGTARASITGPNLSVNSLRLGGFGKVNGTWGSTSSVASFTDDTFFAPTTGYLNVATDTRTSQTINFTSTAPSNATVGGPTYTPTATATSGLAVTLTIDASASSVCSISGGVVSFNAVGTCVINANQAGNANYKPATQAQQSFAVNLPPSIARVYIADEEMTGSPFGLAAGVSQRQSFAGINNGPVKIEGNVDIVAAERLIYKVNGVNTSFSEMMGLPANQLDNVYWLPWYNNVDLDTQLRIANTTGSLATVTVTIGGVEMPSFNLAGGESTRKSYAVNAGPVKIVSTQNIVAAERLIYKVGGVRTSFTETMAVPESQLDNVYWLPWYNNVDLDTQLRIGNVSASAATVHIFIGLNEVTPVEGITLPVGGSTRVSYTGVNNGPVKIVSNQNIVAAERLIYKVNGVNTSFSEMMALPENQLNTTYWLPWYNNVDLDTQLRFANTTNSTANVHIFIGGVEMQGSPFTLLAGESTRQSFANINAGPVKVVSNVPVVVAERLIYKAMGVRTSFTEMMALPNSQLDSTYWFPWYNNVDLDTQLRFGMP